MKLTEIVKKASRDYRSAIRNEFPSSTATLIVFSPIKAVSEKIAQMSDLVSIISRVSAIPITCLEIPALLLGRQYYHQFVGNTKDSPQKTIDKYDRIYAAAATLAINPLVYYFISGERNPLKIAGATIIGMGLNAILIKPSLYLMDIVKDLMGYQTMQEARIKRGIPKELKTKTLIYIRDKSLKFEDWLSKKTPAAKKKGLALMIAGSVAATSSVYVIASYISQNYQAIDAVLK